MMPATTTTEPSDLERAIAFERAQQAAAGARATPHPLGRVVANDDHPNYWMLNELQVTVRAPLDTDALIAAADAAQADRRHRRVFVDDDATGAPAAPGLRERGWRVDHDLYMALRRPPDRRGTVAAREVGIDELLAAKEAVTLESTSAADWAAIRPATRHVAEATGARFFVADRDGRAAAYCTLYSDATIAQVEDVATQRWARGHGLARAVVQAALDVAVAEEHDLIFLVADGDDWPRELYAKLGFDPVGYSWSFIRLPPAKSTASRM